MDFYCAQGGSRGSALFQKLDASNKGAFSSDMRDDSESGGVARVGVAFKGIPADTAVKEACSALVQGVVDNPDAANYMVCATRVGASSDVPVVSPALERRAFDLAREHGTIVAVQPPWSPDLAS